MDYPKESLDGGVYDNYLVHLDENVSYCINILDKKGYILEKDIITSENLVLLLNAIASLLKIHRDTNILNHKDEIIIGDINLEFYRRYIKIDENSLKITINYEFIF